MAFVYVMGQNIKLVGASRPEPHARRVLHFASQCPICARGTFHCVALRCAETILVACRGCDSERVGCRSLLSRRTGHKQYERNYSFHRLQPFGAGLPVVLWLSL
jgi:hypothetical protein